MVAGDRESQDACVSMSCCVGCAPAFVILRWAADGNREKPSYLGVPVAAADQ